MRRRFLSFVFACMTLMLGATPGGDALAGPPGVGVDVRFEVDSVTGLWGPRSRMEAVQNQSSERLARLLMEIFPYWQFTPGANVTRLKFRIMRGLQDNAIIRVVAFLGGQRVRKWDVEWIKRDLPGQLGNPATVPAMLTSAVEVAVIGHHETALHNWLKDEVPVAEGGQWTGVTIPPQAVLALPYNKFGLVGASRFEVLASPGTPSGRTERVKVVGLSLSATYTAPDGGAPFEALVVSAYGRELTPGREDPPDVSGRPKLRDLTLHDVFLLERRRSNDPDVLVAPEDAQ